MSAAKVDLIIEQGATFTKAILWKDSAGAAVNNSTYNMSMQIRENKKDAVPLMAGDSDSGSDKIIITLGGANGIISLTITAANTASLTFINAFYDLIAEDGSDPAVITRLMEGIITLNRAVTR